MSLVKSVARSLATSAIVLGAAFTTNAQNKGKALGQQVFYRTTKVDGPSLF